jgi:hypothetical protein
MLYGPQASLDAYKTVKWITYQGFACKVMRSYSNHTPAPIMEQMREKMQSTEALRAWTAYVERREGVKQASFNKRKRDTAIMEAALSALNDCSDVDRKLEGLSGLITYMKCIRR